MIGEPVLAQPPQRTEVSIEKAKNGYVVSTYGENGCNKYIAKTQKEAQTQATKLLKIKK